jgi:quinohemoprotein ethanol dehydrogenase
MCRMQREIGAKSGLHLPNELGLACGFRRNAHRYNRKFGRFGSVRTSIRLAIAIVTLFVLTAVTARSLPRSINDAATKLMDNSDGVDWPAFGRTFGEQHYTPLTQISDANVGNLGLVWSRDLGSENSTTGPIEIDGKLYFCTGYSVIHAVDAETGNAVWTFDPKAPEVAGKNLRIGWGSHGIAWWKDKIYTGTQDGRLIAIDAKSGTPLWSVQTFDPASARFISGPPRAFDNKVVIGNSSDSGAARGYVTAYDAQTGKELWRFYTVPGNPAAGFENEAMARATRTWSGEYWKFGGGGMVWNAITYDAGSDTLYIGTGNAYPLLPRNRTEDKGDNLYTASIIALDAKSGAYKWHYQVNPRDAWDYDAVMDMELADLSIDGVVRKVLITAPKNGFMYIIDRTNGRIISAEPFAKVTWASRINIMTGRPVENPTARYRNGTSVDIWPSSFGAHNWLPMAFSRRTHFVYVPVTELGMTMSDAGLDAKSWVPPIDRSADSTIKMAFGPGVDAGYGRLLAWDPARRRSVWSAPQPSFATGGVLATAGGLVFEGAVDGTFNAYNDMSGKHVWSFSQDTPIIAPPISYSVNGKQYITVLTGLSGSYGILGPLLAKFHVDPRSQSRRVLTFALGGNGTVAAGRLPAPFTQDPEFNPDQKSADAGAAIYSKCLLCHSVSAAAAEVAPDLRRSAYLLSSEAFRRVVHDCALVANGMPCFAELTNDQLTDLRQYLRTETQKALASARVN